MYILKLFPILTIFSVNADDSLLISTFGYSSVADSGFPIGEGAISNAGAFWWKRMQKRRNMVPLGRGWAEAAPPGSVNTQAVAICRVEETWLVNCTAKMLEIRQDCFMSVSLSLAKYPLSPD